jgi:hypothetical protein
MIVSRGDGAGGGKDDGGPWLHAPSLFSFIKAFFPVDRDVAGCDSCRIVDYIDEAMFKKRYDQVMKRLWITRKSAAALTLQPFSM